MGTIHARIKKSRVNKGLSMAQVGEALGVSTQAVQQWEEEDGTTPRPNRLEKLAVVLDVSPQWLQFGDAENKQVSSQFGDGNHFGDGSSHHFGIGDQYHMTSDATDKDNENKENLIRAMPLLDINQAVNYAIDPTSLPKKIKEYGNKIATFVPHSGNTFGIKMPDDSMTAQNIDSESIYKGDILIIDPKMEPRDADIVLVCLDWQNARRGIIARLEIDLVGKKYLVQVGRGGISAEMPSGSLICGVALAIKRRLVDPSISAVRRDPDWDIFNSLVE